MLCSGSEIRLDKWVPDAGKYEVYAWRRNNDWYVNFPRLGGRVATSVLLLISIHVIILIIPVQLCVTILTNILISVSPRVIN